MGTLLAFILVALISTLINKENKMKKLTQLSFFKAITNNQLAKSLIRVFIATMFFGATSNLALACSSAPPAPPPAWVIWHSANHVWIIFHNYTTFGSQPGQFCSCGLNIASSIGTVDFVQFVNSDTKKPVPGFSFENNDLTASAFSELQAGNWSGFSSSLDQPVERSTPLDIQFSVTLNEGVTPGQLTNALLNGSIGTAEADSSGFPISHISVVSPEQVTIRKQPVIIGVEPVDPVEPTDPVPIEPVFVN